MPTLFETLTAAGLPIQSATENGEVACLPDIIMTPEQQQLFEDILLQYFQPIKWAEVLDKRTNLQTLKDNYQTAITRLEQIQVASNPTNAQVVQAVKDIALIQERTLKVLKQILT